ncbi:bacterial Ig-like domain-containing protein, partial [Enterococcus faecium]
EVNHSAITLKNSITKKYIGDLYGEAELRENIASLKNKEGEDSLTSDRSKVTITAIDQDGKSVALNDLTKKIGTYTITYSYNGVKATESLIVDDSYYVIIPQKYQFDKSPTKEKLNGEVKIVSKSDPTKEYAGDFVIDMTVSSSNNFIFDNGGEYKLTTDSKDLAKKDLVGHFSLANLYPSSKEVEAKLVKRGKKSSSTDSLTFNWRQRGLAATNSIRIKFSKGFVWTENGCLFQNKEPSAPLLKDAKIQKDDGSIENLRMDADRNCYILSENLSPCFMFVNMKIVTSFSEDCQLSPLDDSYSGVKDFKKGKQYKFTIREDGSIFGEEVLAGNSE